MEGLAGSQSVVCRAPGVFIAWRLIRSRPRLFTSARMAGSLRQRTVEIVGAGLMRLLLLHSRSQLIPPRLRQFTQAVAVSSKALTVARVGVPPVQDYRAPRLGLSPSIR